MYKHKWALAGLPFAISLLKSEKCFDEHARMANLQRALWAWLSSMEENRGLAERMYNELILDDEGFIETTEKRAGLDYTLATNVDLKKLQEINNNVVRAQDIPAKLTKAGIELKTIVEELKKADEQPAVQATPTPVPNHAGQAPKSKSQDRKSDSEEKSSLDNLEMMSCSSVEYIDDDVDGKRTREKQAEAAR